MDNVKEYNSALLNLHSEIEALKKSEDNPFFKSSYVPLPAMLKELKPLYQKHGFVLTQPTRVIFENGVVTNVVTSKLTHVNTGLSEVSELALTSDVLSKSDMQKLGGAITYGRRYTLSALNSLEEVDDDGESAVGRGRAKSATSTTKTAKAQSKKPSFRDRKKTTSTPEVVDSGDGLL